MSAALVSMSLQPDALRLSITFSFAMLTFTMAKQFICAIGTATLALRGQPILRV
jgi:hypothetical protein